MSTRLRSLRWDAGSIVDWSGGAKSGLAMPGKLVVIFTGVHYRSAEDEPEG